MHHIKPECRHGPRLSFGMPLASCGIDLPWHKRGILESDPAFQAMRRFGASCVINWAPRKAGFITVSGWPVFIPKGERKALMEFVQAHSGSHIDHNLDERYHRQRGEPGPLKLIC